MKLDDDQLTAVEIAEGLLQRARAGELKFIAAAAVTTDDDTFFVVGGGASGDDALRAAAGLTSIVFQTIHQEGADDDASGDGPIEID
jgi:hypothetical protein